MGQSRDAVLSPRTANAGSMGCRSTITRCICVESYRSEEEKANLLYWQLTWEMFCTPDEWNWWFQLIGYMGDHSFIFFE